MTARSRRVARKASNPVHLGSMERPSEQDGCPVGAPGIARIHRDAEAGRPFLAVRTESAGDVERQADRVADLHSIHRGPHPGDHARIRVTEDAARLDTGVSLVHMCRVDSQMLALGDRHQHSTFALLVMVVDQQPVPGHSRP